VKSKPIIAWMVKDIKGELRKSSLSYSRARAAKAFEYMSGVDWKVCYRQGFRVVKVRIEEI